YRRKHTDIGHGSRHAARQRLIARATKQRIQPDHTAGSLLQLRQGRCELFRLACIPAITQNYDHRSSVYAAEPLLIETRETRTDSCSSATAAHVHRESIERPLVSLAF